MCLKQHNEVIGSFIVITIIANQRGLNDAAAVRIVEKIISFLFLVPSSMLSTVSTLFPMGLATTAGSFVSVIICIGVFIWMQRKVKKDG